MASDKKERRPRAETPKGFRDVFAAEIAERNAMLAAIAAVYHRYGFDPLETPAVETVEVLGKFLPDVDRPNEGVFAWQDEDEAWLALRYDLTAPLARVYAQYRNELPTPYRRYAMGPVWRNEKPGPGRFRQFYQCDADTVGTGSVAADAEMCMMLCDALDEVGLKGQYIVKFSNRKVLNAAMESVGLLDPNDPSRNAVQRGIAMRAIDKFDRLGIRGVRALLGGGRTDESGDFTTGAGLTTLQTATILEVIGVSSEVSTYGDKQLETFAPSIRYGSTANDFERQIETISRLVGGTRSGKSGIDELRQMAELVSSANFSSNQILFEPSIVRGLAYYTGPVFEAELTFEILDEKGRKRQFGSIAGGGRYDDLVKRFTGQEVPATGVSIGVDRLLAALRAKRGASAEVAGPAVVTVMDRERMADYFAMAAELRAAGIRAEVFTGNPKDLGRQLKYADQRNAPVAVIQGGSERDKGTVQLKDLALGARLAAGITTNEEWKAQPAQSEVRRADLVAEVRAMIARAQG